MRVPVGGNNGNFNRNLFNLGFNELKLDKEQLFSDRNKSVVLKFFVKDILE